MRGTSVIKRIVLLTVGLWLAEIAMSLLFRALYNVIGVPTGAWMPVAVALGFAVSAIPYVLAAWMIGRWAGLEGLQLLLTTVVAYLLGVAVGVLVVGPVVTVFLTKANPVMPGFSSGISDYGITALVGLFGSVVGVAVYWLVALASKTWVRPQANAAV
jgi:hypothetical protein